MIDGKRHAWDVPRLWELAAELQPFDFEVASFKDFDEDFCFCDRHKPTLRKILEHQKRIAEADLSHPIILNKNGAIMDGLHRLCRAMHEGRTHIKAVRFAVNPEPDSIF